MFGFGLLVWGGRVFGFLRRFVQRFVSPDEVGRLETLVWDTSSLSHAFEDFVHAAASAYREMRPPRDWFRLRLRLLRRFDSEAVARKMLVSCDLRECLVPESVWRELSRKPDFVDELELLSGRTANIEKRYARGRGVIAGFGAAWRARLKPAKPNETLVQYVLRKAKQLGYKISREDAEGIALALEKNAILVTADRRQAELADKLGVKVLYTIPEIKEKFELKTLSL